VALGYAAIGISPTPKSSTISSRTAAIAPKIIDQTQSTACLPFASQRDQAVIEAQSDRGSIQVAAAALGQAETIRLAMASR
jgi:hypothetical protein